MMQSSKSKKQPKPTYDNTLQDQTMLYWRLQQQWNGDSVPGYLWNTGDALRLLGAMAMNESLPMSLRISADRLNYQIIRNEHSPKLLDNYKNSPAELLTLPH